MSSLHWKVNRGGIKGSIYNVEINNLKPHNKEKNKLFVVYFKISNEIGRLHL